MSYIKKQKNNQTSVSDADRDIQPLGSTDNAGNSVNLVSDIIHLPSGWDFLLCFDVQWLIDSFYLKNYHQSHHILSCVHEDTVLILLRLDK